MNLSKILVTTTFILTAQTGITAELSFKAQCNQTYQNIKKLEGIVDQFKPGSEIVGLKKNYLKTHTGVDVSSNPKMTNGLRIKLIKRVSVLEDKLNYCKKDIRASN